MARADRKEVIPPTFPAPACGPRAASAVHRLGATTSGPFTASMGAT